MCLFTFREKAVQVKNRLLVVSMNYPHVKMRLLLRSTWWCDSQKILMESEFFGYKKGSFTGADQDRLGFFQHAHGGTLFLDEVADLPLAMQVKLLRAIQEKSSSSYW